MPRVRVAAIVSFAFVCGAHPLFAQELSRYRGYALESSVGAVVALTGARESAVETDHERPAKVQQLEWRTPYVSGGAPADPVRSLQFAFYDDQLYQIVVTYDRDRMEGLTNDDIKASISETYGASSALRTRAARTDLPPGVSGDNTIVAQWENAASLLTLTRGIYSPELQLVLISKALNARARAAIAQALRLDAQEAPQRELDQRRKDAAAARVAVEKARVTNKAAFRP